MEASFTVSNLTRSGHADGRIAGTLNLRDRFGRAVRASRHNTRVAVQVHKDGRWRHLRDVEVAYDGPRGLDVTLVADNSGSERGNLKQIHAAARTFASALFDDGGTTRLGLVRVSSQAQAIQELTGSPVQFDAAIDRLFITNGWTALYDGVREANDMLERGVLQVPVGSRNACADQAARAIVVFTDGGENNSLDQNSAVEDGDGIDTELDDLTDLTVFASATPVFVVGIGSNLDRESLGALAGLTEGEYVPVEDFAELVSGLDDVAQNLSSAVPVCFTLPEDDSIDQVRMIVHQRDERGNWERVVRHLSVPDNDCERPFRPSRIAWQPPTRLDCPETVFGGSATTDQLVYLADMGCHGDTWSARLDDPEGPYRPPSQRERGELAQLLPSFFAALQDTTTDLEPIARGLREMGVRVNEFDVNGDRLVVVYESGEHWRGVGGYIFRRGPGVPEVIIQTPHSFFEGYSMVIGRRLLAQQPVRGMFFNTLHRHYLAPREVCGDVYPADVAHVTNSFFHSMTTAYLSDTPEGTVVQLHGFIDDLNTDEQVVVSAGTRAASREARDVHRQLEQLFGEAEVSLFPNETHRYGATQNIQGRWVHEQLRGRFVHVELERDLSALLREDMSVIDDLGAALLHFVP